MRYFPSAARRRLTLAALAGVVALGGLSVPLANAAPDDDDKGLADRQEQVEDQIDQASTDLEHASLRVQRRNAALSSAQASLIAARNSLVGAQGELADVQANLAQAQVTDAAMAAKLTFAEFNLAKSRLELRHGRRAVVVKRDEVADTMVSIYEQGDPQLLAYSTLLEARSLADLTRSTAAQDAIVNQESLAYDDLREAEKQLLVREDEVETAKDDAAAQRRAAADNLDLMETLTEEARVAKAIVRGLVTTGRTASESAAAARRAAYRARERDAAELAALEEREEKIKEMILAAAAAAAAKDTSPSYTGATGELLNYPVNGSVTSPFGYRTHPIYGYYSLHDGTDFGAGCGSSLFAGAAGTVLKTYYDSVYGNRLYLSVGRVNGSSLTMVYNHASGYNVSEGDQVGRGDVIGSVGTTGWSTGCHLHLTVLADGEPVDPMQFF